MHSKIKFPLQNDKHVPRTALCEAIAKAQGQVTLVRAPAGFGKSTVMAQSRQLLEADGVMTAWLVLDAADNDVSRLLAGLSQAWCQLGLLPDRAGVGLPSVYELVRAWSNSTVAFALFLDDFETVHEPAALSLVQDLMAQLPGRGRLVLGTRTLPALGLARLRTRRQLLELDIERLRFSLDETRQLWEQRQLPALDHDGLVRLHAKTEGWIAALWLAAMALQRQEDPHGFVERFSGSNRAVAEYLAEDVLAQQSPQLRHFLLHTSILRQLDAGVCSALLPRVDCHDMLARLDAAHLLLAPLSSDRRVWRHHSLFADYLRRELQREQPDEVIRLHLAAAGWYEAQGRPVPAIEHAIEGGDHPLALELLQQHAEQLLQQGRMRLLTRWFQAMPPSLLQQYPDVEIIAVWAATFTVGPGVAMDWLDAVQRRNPGHTGVQAHALCMRPVLLAMLDRSQEAFELGHRALEQPFSGKPFADSCLLNAMAQINSVLGAPHESQRLLDAARREQGEQSIFHRMYTETTEGLLDLQQGRLHQAAARFRLAVDATPVSHNSHHTHGNAWAGVLYAYTVYEANRLDEAQHLLNAYLPLARDVGLPDHMILSHVMRSRIGWAQGDLDAALLALTELEYLGHQRKLPRVVAGAKIERARLLMRQGHEGAALDELARADDAHVWQREARERLLAHDLESMDLARLRWALAFGAVDDALVSRMEQLGAHAQSQMRGRRLLVLQSLRALAWQRQGDWSTAVQSLGQVLQTCCREGFVRLLVDEGAALGSLVQRYKALHNSGPAPDPILSEYLQRLLTAFGPLPEEPEPGVSGGQTEPLTPREIGVLKLLVEGYSNGAMAEKLFVSDSTVRTHLRNINMKLGANNRTQAVAIARRLGLV